MIISFSGAVGSGKSTVAERLAQDLGLKRYYMGALRREAAKKRGLTLAEYNELGETDPATDREVDEYQRELGKKEDNFIIEGRTSWYFIPHSLKIYLDVDPKEGARRVYGALKKKNDRNEDKPLNSLEEVAESADRRFESDRRRYQKYYGVDVNDSAHYDLFLDTTHLNPEEAYQAVWKFIKERLDNGKK